MLGDYVDYLIDHSSAEAPMWNIEKVRSGQPNKWNYIDGCINHRHPEPCIRPPDRKNTCAFPRTSSTILCSRTAPSRPLTRRSTTWTM